MKIINPYIKKLNRVEFVITDGCTSRCKHCSEGVHHGKHRLDGEIAAAALSTLLESYPIDSIMTFGGEALLCPEATAKIHLAAKAHQVRQQQLITNGCFSKDPVRINEVAIMLEEAGVNDILLSVDCFHEEYLPLNWVRMFTEALKEHYTGQLRLQPSWVKDACDNNPYNQKTLECLSYFDDLKIPHADGDIIFPQGNATQYLSDYFVKEPIDESFQCGDAPYSSDLSNIDSISIDCNGNVIPCSFPIGNIYNETIDTILTQYDPYADSLTKALIEHGISGLVEEAKSQDIHVHMSQYYSPCQVCNAIFKKKNHSN